MEWNNWLTLFTIIISIYAVCQTVAFNKYQKKIHKLQGIFKKPQIKFLPFNRSDIDEFILILPLKKDTVFEFPFKFTIKNIGDKTSTDLEIYIRGSSALFFSGAKYSTASEINKKITFHQDKYKKHLSSLIMSIDDLHPKQLFNVHMPFCFTRATNVPFDVPVKSKDGVDFNIHGFIKYGFTINALVSQKDFDPISSQFLIQVYDSGSKSSSELINEIVNKRKDEAAEKLKQVKLLYRLFLYLKKPKVNKIGFIELCQKNSHIKKIVRKKIVFSHVIIDPDDIELIVLTEKLRLPK